MGEPPATSKKEYCPENPADQKRFNQRVFFALDGIKKRNERKPGEKPEFKIRERQNQKNCRKYSQQNIERFWQIRFNGKEKFHSDSLTESVLTEQFHFD